MSTKEIEGYVSDATMHSSQDAGGLWLFTDRVTKNPATLIIHSGERERVYTQSEVKAMLERLVAMLPKEYDERVDMAANTIGITL